MLIEFSVENYRSIKERVTLSLVASKDREHLENVFSPGMGKDLSLLKSVLIYGANASGKSNLVKALTFMTGFVSSSATGRQMGDAIPVEPFRLDPETAAQPSLFEVVFVADGQRYVYGFTADTERVHEEWLTAARRKARLLFRRSPDGSIRFGDSWQGDRQTLEKATRPNALLVSVAVQFNNRTAKPVFDWFRGKVSYTRDSPEAYSEMLYTKVKLARDPAFSEQVASFAKVADLGIDRFVVEKVPITGVDLFAGMPEAERTELVSKLPEPLLDTISTRVRTVHSRTDAAEVYFDLERDESAGTIRLFALAALWLDALREGFVLVVDELESSLHPLITRFLLGLIHGSAAAQLVATTHDCGLLDSQLFRRDQIWLMEKDPKTAATKLYSLWDYDVRRGADIRAGYLKGRYGAIPFIGELRFGETER